MTGFLAQHGSEIAELTLEHLWLTGSAMLLAAAIGVPTGIWLTRPSLIHTSASRREQTPARAITLAMRWPGRTSEASAWIWSLILLCSGPVRARVAACGRLS